MLKTSTLFFLLSAWAAAASAQSDLQPGYIIQPAGDTVRGEVAALGTQRGLRQCLFRPAPAAAVVTYQPQQLRGYGITGVKDYRTGLVPVADTVKAPRFMEVLVQGKATLLFSADDNNDPHFFMQRAGEAAPQELRLVVRTVYNNGRTYRQEVKQYQQVLLSAFADYPELAPRIRQARFGVPDLVPLFQRYNEQAGSAVKVSRDAAARARFRLGLAAGASLGGKMTISSASSGGYYNTTLTKPTSLLAGIQMAANSPRLSRSLWLHVGALYHERAYSGQEARNASQVTSTLDDYYVLNYQATYLMVPVLLRFEKKQGRIKPLAELGIGFNFRLTEANNGFTIHYTNQQTPTTRVLFADSRVYEQSGLLGLGLTTAVAGGHHTSLVVRYEVGNGVSSYLGVRSTTKTLSALLSYDIIGK